MALVPRGTTFGVIGRASNLNWVRLDHSDEHSRQTPIKTDHQLLISTKNGEVRLESEKGEFEITTLMASEESHYKPEVNDIAEGDQPKRTLGGLLKNRIKDLFTKK